MQIIWDKTIVEKLRERYTVLELETFLVEGKEMTAYCVVPTEKIGITGFFTLQKYTEIHEEFIRALNNKDYDFCRNAAPYLMGQFGGELDSFYETIIERVGTTNKNGDVAVPKLSDLEKQMADILKATDQEPTDS